jgi:hypothetical protein
MNRFAFGFGGLVLTQLACLAYLITTFYGS